jgi:PadR family transcriptional regulator, regulatory protein PadR
VCGGELHAHLSELASRLRPPFATWKKRPCAACPDGAGSGSGDPDDTEASVGQRDRADRRRRKAGRRRRAIAPGRFYWLRPITSLTVRPDPTGVLRQTRVKVTPTSELVPPVAFQKKLCDLPVGNQKDYDMGQKRDVQQGTLALMVLKTLDVLGPLHGYGIARRIEQISGDLLAVNQGTLYPLLLKLEQEGGIASEWGASENNRRARFYRLTAAGRRQLLVETRDWEQTAALIQRFVVVKADDLQ